MPPPGANGLYIDQRPPSAEPGADAGAAQLRAVWAQAARVEAMRAARRAAEAEADDEATDDEAEAAAEEDELLLAAGLHLSPGGCPLAAAVCSRQLSARCC